MTRASREAAARGLIYLREIAADDAYETGEGLRPGGGGGGPGGGGGGGGGAGGWGRGEGGPAQVGPAQVGSAQVGAVQAGAGEVALAGRVGGQ